MSSFTVYKTWGTGQPITLVFPRSCYPGGWSVLWFGFDSYGGVARCLWGLVRGAIKYSVVFHFLHSTTTTYVSQTGHKKLYLTLTTTLTTKLYTYTKRGGTLPTGTPAIAVNVSPFRPCYCLSDGKRCTNVSIRLTARTFSHLKCGIRFRRVG